MPGPLRDPSPGLRARLIQRLAAGLGTVEPHGRADDGCADDTPEDDAPADDR